MLKTTLFKAIDAADIVICDGYEIGEFRADTEDTRRLSFDRGAFTWDFKDQDIEVCFDGKCEAMAEPDSHHDGLSVDLQFQMKTALTAKDIADLEE